MADAEPGLLALTAGLEASGRWSLANRAVAQLLFWRPVPSFEPSAERSSPSVEMVALQRPRWPTPSPPGSSAPAPTPTKPSTWCPPSSSACSARPWPTNPTSTGAKDASPLPETHDAASGRIPSAPVTPRLADAASRPTHAATPDSTFRFPFLAILSLPVVLRPVPAECPLASFLPPDAGAPHRSSRTAPRGAVPSNGERGHSCERRMGGRGRVLWRRRCGLA